MNALAKRQTKHHEAVIRWHKLALKAHSVKMPEKLIYRHSLPINVHGEDWVMIYVDRLKSEIQAFCKGLPSPFKVYR